jgi:hypothetical protein
MTIGLKMKILSSVAAAKQVSGSNVSWLMLSLRQTITFSDDIRAVADASLVTLPLRDGLADSKKQIRVLATC